VGKWPLIENYCILGTSGGLRAGQSRMEPLNQPLFYHRDSCLITKGEVRYVGYSRNGGERLKVGKGRWIFGCMRKEERMDDHNQI
jgi:hypothetical protein